MDKYNELAAKMDKAINIISKIKSISPATSNFLVEFGDYITKTKKLLINREIAEAKGGLLGLLRWLSDYSELENNEELWTVITDIEEYYKNNF